VFVRTYVRLGIPQGRHSRFLGVGGCRGGWGERVQAGAKQADLAAKAPGLGLLAVPHSSRAGLFEGARERKKGRPRRADPFHHPKTVP